jgi:hypothetical protein
MVSYSHAQSIGGFALHTGANRPKNVERRHKSAVHLADDCVKVRIAPQAQFGTNNKQKERMRSKMSAKSSIDH